MAADEIKSHLLKGIIGENSAMEALSLCIDRHYQVQQLNKLYKDRPQYILLKIINTLLAEPLGSGKSTSVREL